MTTIHLIQSIHETDLSDKKKILQFLSPTETSSRLIKRFYRTYKMSAVETLSRENLDLITQMGIDLKLAELISRIHKQHPLDYIFSDDFSKYRGLLRYCQRKKIKTETTGCTSIADKFNFVYFCTGDSENLAHIIYPDEIRQLTGLYQQEGFMVQFQ